MFKVMGIRNVTKKFAGRLCKAHELYCYATVDTEREAKKLLSNIRRLSPPVRIWIKPVNEPNR